MAIHSIDVLLISRGFTTAEIRALVDAGLLERLEVRYKLLVRTTKPPSRWPKPYREIWQSHMGKGRHFNFWHWRG